MEQQLKQIPIRAPQDHGDYLIRGQRPAPIGPCRAALDVCFPFAKEARRELLGAAIRWSGQYLDADLSTPAGDPSLMLSGHQPELFHPGVWFKNFVLDKWQSVTGQLSINLVVDNDQQNANWLSFPGKRGQRTAVVRENFDHGGIGQPYEERMLRHEDRFGDLVQRVQSRVASIAPAELLVEFWTHLRQLPIRNLGHRFAAARHRMEWQRGVRNLEVPLSHVCQTSGFAHFAHQLISDAPQFQTVYNQVLVDYRRQNDLSGQDRPIPNLERYDQWWEVPFWVWSPDHPYRQRAFVRQRGNLLELTGEAFLAGQARTAMNPCPIREATSLLELPGWKLRTRALTTTMYSRAILGDGFLHGIGGAIYDQLTDEMFRRYFQQVLPPFLTATATMRLTGESEPDLRRALQQARATLRKMKWKSEAFLPQDGRSQELAQTKRDLIANQPTHDGRGPMHERERQWHRSIRDIQIQMQEILQPEIQQQEMQVAEAAARWEQWQLESSREWSFLLFSDSLAGQLKAMADQAVDRFLKHASATTMVELGRDRCETVG